MLEIEASRNVQRPPNLLSCRCSFPLRPAAETMPAASFRFPPTLLHLGALGMLLHACMMLFILLSSLSFLVPVASLPLLVYQSGVAAPSAPAAAGCGGSGTPRVHSIPEATCWGVQLYVGDVAAPSSPSRLLYRAVLRCGVGGSTASEERHVLTLFGGQDTDCSGEAYARYEGAGGECSRGRPLRNDSDATLLDTHRISIAIHCDKGTNVVAPSLPPPPPVNVSSGVQVTLFASPSDVTCRGEVKLQMMVPLYRCARVSQGVYARALCSEAGDTGAVTFFRSAEQCARYGPVRRGDVPSELPPPPPFVGLNGLSCADASYALAGGSHDYSSTMQPVFASVRCHLDTRSPTHFALFNPAQADPVVVTRPLGACLPWAVWTRSPSVAPRYMKVWCERDVSDPSADSEFTVVTQFFRQADCSASNYSRLSQYMREEGGYVNWVEKLAEKEQMTDGGIFMQCIHQNPAAAEEEEGSGGGGGDASQASTGGSESAPETSGGAALHDASGAAPHSLQSVAMPSAALVLLLFLAHMC